MLIRGSAHRIPLRGGCVQCVVTSPPYFGLRSYNTPPQIWGGEQNCQHDWTDELRVSNRERNGGHDGFVRRDRGETHGRGAGRGQSCSLCGSWIGELGLEPTVELYAEHIVQVFREVRRVLHSSGTVWCNLGDSFANDGKWGGSTSGKHIAALHGATSVGRERCFTGLKPKDLIGVPWRVAFALQADGWYLRSAIILAKRNPMPESINDRPVSSHEYLFLLSKSARYFYDHIAIQEPSSASSIARISQPNFANQTGGFKDYRNGVNPNRSIRNTLENFAKSPHTRNKRDVWWITTQPNTDKVFDFTNADFFDSHGRPHRISDKCAIHANADSPISACCCPFAYVAHFATFGDDVVIPCILAGTSEHGCCGKCGAPYKRILGISYPVEGRGAGNGFKRDARLSYLDPNGARGDETAWTPKNRDTVGWRAQCACDANRKPCLVFDPFAGSGTVGRVAERLGRRWAVLDLQPDYLKIAARRTAQRGLSFVNSTLNEEPIGVVR